MLTWNLDNMEKLTNYVVDSWDMDTLIQYAKDRLMDAYRNDKELFEEDWKTCFGEPEED
jgi:hypothetical protein